MFLTVRRVGLIAVIVALASCGEPVGSRVPISALPPSTAPLPRVTSSSTDSSVPSPPDTVESIDGVPNPDELQWLAPAVPPTDLPLVGAHRGLGCGSGDDCLVAAPTARLDYRSDGEGRAMTISQWLPAPGDERVGTPSDGEERVVADRTVVAVEDGDRITAGWTEADGVVVQITTFGVAWRAIADVITSLVRWDAVDWPGSDVTEPSVPCVDAGSQYAPSVVPDGWVRFVLDAQPSGTCGGANSILFMSLVIPGTEEGPGTLVTFVTSWAGPALPGTGRTVMINDRPAVLNEAVGADGRPVTAIEIRFDDVVVEAHGNADVDTLVALMETVRLLDADEWAALVAEIVSE